MAQDLVAQIVQGLGSGTTDQLSAAVGIDRDAAQKAVTAAVPAILAGLVGIVSRPGGADRLSSALGQLQSLGISGDAVRSIGQAGPQTLMTQGSSLLSSLFGGQGADGLASAIARFAGLDQGVAGKLLGFATPLVLGLLGRQAETAGTGPAGLATMLLGQKDAIANALPPGLANRLQASGLLSGIADRLAQRAAQSSAALDEGVSAATSAVSDLGAKVAQSAASAVRTPKPAAAGLPRWLLGLAAVVILAIVAYWLWGRGEVQQAVNQPPQTVGSGTSIAPGSLDLGRQLADTVDHTRTALQQVSDPDSAKRALPQLNDMLARLDKLRDAAAQAPPEQKKIVADMIDKTQSSLKAAIDEALAKPGVSDVLKPTLDAFRSKLAALSSA